MTINDTKIEAVQKLDAELLSRKTQMANKRDSVLTYLCARADVMLDIENPMPGSTAEEAVEATANFEKLAKESFNDLKTMAEEYFQIQNKKEKIKAEIDYSNWQRLKKSL